MSEEALKLTTYFGERTRLGGKLFADELLDIHANHRIRCSILLRGAQGFGAKHHRRSDRLLTLSEDLPLVSIAVDAREPIEEVIREMSTTHQGGLLTLEPALLGDPSPEPNVPPGAAGEGLKLTVYVGRHERVDGSPAFAAVCELLRDCGVSGATALLGVDGARCGERLRARFFARNADVPLMVISVGDPGPIASAIERLTSVLSDPLFTLERSTVCKRDGVLLGSPEKPPSSARDPKIHHKLTIVTSEAARDGNRPLYLELVRRLRGANAAGATSLRGIWGFHGDHEPHGDRLLSIGRRVPIVTEVIDTPERIAALFPIVDELTRKRGLVTSELVPTSSPLQAIPGL
jgi:PII-like signaling protein